MTGMRVGRAVAWRLIWKGYMPFFVEPFVNQPLTVDDVIMQ
jgi:hypothetical protein